LLDDIQKFVESNQNLLMGDWKGFRIFIGIK
jgi:hypothetical protein